MIADSLIIIGQIQFNLTVKKRYLIGPDLKKIFWVV